MKQEQLVAEVYERKDAPGIWAVEAIGHQSEGEVYVALFDGPRAQDRAREYAAAKYVSAQPQRRSA